MFADDIRRAVMASPRTALAEVAKALWSAVAGGHISETDAESLSDLIEARKVVPVRPEPARVGSRPITIASVERRRRWAASGLLPPVIASHFTQGEVAVLAVLALEVSRNRDCRWPLARLAAIAGVSITTVKRAIREAKRLGLVEVEERRVSWWRNDTNVVTITSPLWVAWLSKGGGGGQTWPRSTSRASRRAIETTETGSKGIRGRGEGETRRQKPPRIATAGRRRASAPWTTG